MIGFEQDALLEEKSVIFVKLFVLDWILLHLFEEELDDSTGDDASKLAKNWELSYKERRERERKRVRDEFVHLEHFSTEVEWNVLAVDDSGQETQISRHQLFG